MSAEYLHIIILHMYPSSNFKESSWDKERKGKKNKEGGRVAKKGKRREGESL